jgi:hypothetical protein
MNDIRIEAREEREVREAMICAVLDVIGFQEGQAVGLVLVGSVLIDVFGFLLEIGTQTKPIGNIDIAASEIGQEIAARAHELRLASKKEALQ